MRFRNYYVFLMLAQWREDSVPSYCMAESDVQSSKRYSAGQDD